MSGASQHESIGSGIAPGADSGLPRTQPGTLEERLARVEQALREEQDLRAIEQLRYRYWYAILDKDVDTLIDCFTADALLEYGFEIELRGVDAIRPFFQKLLGAENLVRQVPRGSNGALELRSETEARGRWMVDVLLVRKDDDAGTGSTVQYFEDYRKTEAGWKIASISNGYLGFQRIELKDDPF